METKVALVTGATGIIGRGSPNISPVWTAGRSSPYPARPPITTTGRGSSRTLPVRTD